MFNIFGLLRKRDCMQVSASVEGMRCEKCAARVKKALSDVSGVISADVDLEGKEVSILIREGVDLKKLETAISGCGYTVNSINNVGKVLMR